jgi:sucrose-phosphate synthase
MLALQTNKVANLLVGSDRLGNWSLISDIDNTLIGDRLALKELVNYLNSSKISFGVATGRSIESAQQILEEWQVPPPDLWITSVGSEIHYGIDVIEDMEWREYIDYQWQPELVRKAIADLSGMEMQSIEGQRLHKISYLVNPTQAPSLAEIQRHLLRYQLNVQTIYSHQEFLDILPIRASKGDAVNYCADKWNFSMEQILVAGDSGNDEQMLAGKSKAVVVGNYSPELEKLRGKKNVYFAEGFYAQGILEAIAYYGFY